MQNKPKAPKRFVFLITQLVNRYFSHDVGRDSAALTYYLLFAIFPLLIFVSTLLGVLRLDIESTSAFLLEFIPADVVDVVRSYLVYVSENASRQLMWFSLVFSIWFPMRAASCLMHSVRKAMGRGRLASLSLICSRKAGYTAHSVHGSKPGSTAMQVQSGTVQRSLTTKGVRLCTISGLHSGRVRASHAIGTGPSAAGKKCLPPASTPDWA